MKVKFKLNHEDSQLPQLAHEEDAGMDIKCINDVVVPAGGSVIIDTGLSVEMELPWILRFFFKPVMILKSKSGLSCKHRLEVGAGVIDCGYDGIIKVLIYNHGIYPYEFNKGDKICQAVFHMIPKTYTSEAKELKGGKRGDSGFGSTGLR